MIISSSIRDEFIISRSFRFISPNLQDAEQLFKNVDYDLETSYFSTAVGDNRYVNPLPGYNFNTDPSPGIINSGITNSLGNLGRYYKRMIDDNASTLTLTAGAPEFTGILTFLINSFDYASSLVTNKGRSPSWAFYITEAITSIAFYPFQLIGTGINFLGFLTETPKNSWYYVKDSMGEYLAAAQGILNDLVIASGFGITVLPSGMNDQGNNRRNGAAYSTGGINGYDSKSTDAAKADNIRYMNSLYPDAINDDGTIDIVKIIGRGPRKYRYFLSQVKNLDNRINGTVTYEQKRNEIDNILQSLMKDPEFLSGNKNGVGEKGLDYYLKKELSTVGLYRGNDEITNPELASSYYDPALAKEVKPSGAGSEYYKQNSTSDALTDVLTKAGISSSGVTAVGDYAKTGLESTNPYNSIEVNSSPSEDGWLGTISSLLQDMFLGGVDSVTFRIEGGAGAVSDSFSNQTQQSEVASFFNGTVNAVNNFKFNTQGGATGIGVVDGVINRIKDAALGVASGSVIGNPILALFGNARLNIPEHWADATSNLHTESFEIYCEANYANPYSITTNILLPLALIAPFIFPVSTGGSTYTTPFMCKAFSRGRTVIDKGIVKNASITFGEGENGWTLDRQPLNMRIRLEIADLDGHLAIPVVRIKNALEVFNVSKVSGNYLGNVGNYNAWLARIGGQSHLDTILKYNRLNQRVTRFTNDFQEIFSPSRIAASVAHSIPSEIVKLFYGTPLRR